MPLLFQQYKLNYTTDGATGRAGPLTLTPFLSKCNHENFIYSDAKLSFFFNLVVNGSLYLRRRGVLRSSPLINFMILLRYLIEVLFNVLP